MISPVDAWVAARTGLAGELSMEALARWQMARVRKVVAYAQERSRFYGTRLAGIDPRSLTSPADLARLPFTWPAEIARGAWYFLCVPPTEVTRVTTQLTSGSTGERKRVFFTGGDLERTIDFFAHGMSTLAEAGTDTLIHMSDQTEYSIGRLLQAGLARIGGTSRIGCPDWDALQALAAARSADCLVGIPAQIMAMCRTDRDLRPGNVLLSADYVPQPVIAGIEETWHCRVFTHYGMTETGFGGAVQCGVRSGHHLRAADLLVEIVDPRTGERLAPGEWGEIVITTLRNEAMPLVRYRTGDLSRLLVAPCGCGGVLPRLDRVLGRAENEIPLRGGESLSIHRLDEVMFAFPAVRGYTAELLRENGREVLRLTVAAGRALAPAEVSARLPGGLEVELRYGAVSPFPMREKRRIRVVPLPPGESTPRGEERLLLPLPGPATASSATAAFRASAWPGPRPGDPAGPNGPGPA
ncbi:MAG TPA: AMP-binding protein [Candidatus Aminicenantes bacterium]|nr:AMP-binding protein [Candidatus Aminicenantes bacterium]